MADSKIGTVLNDRYKITEKLGRGGMAEVYLAQDSTLGRMVAVKVMLAEYASDPEFSRRFKQEAAAAANLQHPNIVNVYDWGQDGDLQYMVMEYVKGEDLKSKIERDGKLSPKVCAKIGSQVCSALSAAHHLDIIHRDVKPQNIMVQPNGVVKVMDFGIAQARNSLAQKTSTVLGTAHYISPEQAQGKDLEAQSDIYSLGIVLYEAVTGVLPFDGDNAVAVATHQVKTRPTPLCDIDPAIPHDFEAIVMKTLRKNPSERYISCGEMQRDLDAFVDGKLLPSSSGSFTSAMTQAYPAAPAQPAYQDTATMMMPSVEQQGQASGYTANNEPVKFEGGDGEEPDEGSSKKKRIAVIAVCAIAAIAVIGVAIAFAMGAFNHELPRVPDVTGKAGDVAIAELVAAGYEIGEQTTETSKTVPEGAVISTDPKAGSELAQGEKVKLVISSGKNKVKVPELYNLTEAQALRALEQAGLEGKAGSPKASSTVAEGKVISQDIQAGDTVEEGTVVTYVLSTGADNVTVPDVTGMTEADALKALTDAGLTASVGSRVHDDTVAKDRVVSQNPSSGIKVEAGTAVSLVVSDGVEESTVPSLEGLSQTAARSTLTNAGLVLGTVTEEPSNEAKGTVLRQSLNAGDKVRSGSVVDIVISSGPTTNNNNNNSSNNTNNSSNNSSNANNSNSNAANADD